MPIRYFDTTTGLELYVRFFDDDDTAVDLPEGTGIELRNYVAEDAAIVSAGLDAGTYYPCIFAGDYSNPSDSDLLVATVPDGFVWDGTTETTLVQQIANSQPNATLTVENTSITIRTTSE